MCGYKNTDLLLMPIGILYTVYTVTCFLTANRLQTSPPKWQVKAEAFGFSKYVMAELEFLWSEVRSAKRGRLKTGVRLDLGDRIHFRS